MGGTLRGFTIEWTHASTTRIWVERRVIAQLARCSQCDRARAGTAPPVQHRHRHRHRARTPSAYQGMLR